MFSKILKSKRPRNFFLVFAGVLFLDQLLKNIFLKAEMFQKNYAALFGLKIDSFASFLILFIFLVGTLLFLKKKENAQSFTLPIILIFAGISSNLIDRLCQGFIIDYIRLSDIFIFNIADLAILFGAILFIWQIIKE